MTSPSFVSIALSRSHLNLQQLKEITQRPKWSAHDRREIQRLTLEINEATSRAHRWLAEIHPEIN